MMHIRKRLPSWTGGVPSPMSEANRTRWGGGFPTDRNPVIQSEAWDLHHPVSRHSLRSVWIHPSLSRRGVFDDKITYRLTYRYSMNYKDVIISEARDLRYPVRFGRQ
jgi:hypothetical protein